MAELRFGGIRINQPTAVERQRGELARVTMYAFTSKGAVRDIALTEKDLIRLLREGSKYLAILRDVA